MFCAGAGVLSAEQGYAGREIPRAARQVSPVCMILHIENCRGLLYNLYGVLYRGGVPWRGWSWW